MCRLDDNLKSAENNRNSLHAVPIGLNPNDCSEGYLQQNDVTIGGAVLCMLKLMAKATDHVSVQQFMSCRCQLS